MLLTITTTGAHGPATDLGYLLHKHPDRSHAASVSAGTAHVFYPEATQARCTAALLLEVDPIALVRGRRPGGDGAFALAQYVNDRPYVASSMFAVALSRVFRTALAGTCDARPELVDRRWPLEVEVPVLPCRGGPAVAERLFAPLGWTVQATALPLDPQLPQWGDARYVTARLSGTLRLADALSHLYVLLPVLDDAKHYRVGPDEVDKLVRAGDRWLAAHPERDLITRRYLTHRTELVRTAVARLAELDDTDPDPLEPAGRDEEAPPRRPSLAGERARAVHAALRDAGASRVVDLGCGSGALLQVLLADPVFTELVGVDVSHRALELAGRRLRLDRLGERQRDKVRLLQSSLTYRDERLSGYDAIVLMEVVEHVDPPRLPALARTVFGDARPSTVVITTPNAEYNVRYRDLVAGGFRHPDHRFEWTRAQFRAWADAVATEHGYRASYRPVGEDDPVVGPPTQLAVFERAATP